MYEIKFKNNKIFIDSIVNKKSIFFLRCDESKCVFLFVFFFQPFQITDCRSFTDKAIIIIFVGIRSRNMCFTSFRKQSQVQQHCRQNYPSTEWFECKLVSHSRYRLRSLSHIYIHLHMVNVITVAAFTIIYSLCGTTTHEYIASIRSFSN